MNINKLYPLTLTLALAAILLAGGCRNRQSEPAEQVSGEVPPSIAGDSAGSRVLVQLSEREADELNVPLQTVTTALRKQTLTAPGTVNAAPNHIGILSAPVDGRVLNIPVREGQRVQRGQVVLELESLAYGTLVADYLQALAEVDLQSSQLQRIRQLVEKRINPEAELEQVKADYVRAQASQNAAFARLKTVGVSDSEIDALRSTDRINPRLKVHSPISGVVNSHRVELGQAVAANETMGTIISLDQVLIRAYLAPEDGTLVQPGDSVAISHRLISEEPVHATVSTINPGLDETNRSVIVNILISQKNSLLKPGDNVRTDITTSIPVPVITVTMDAVTYDNNDPVVFVKAGVNTFEMRRIRIKEIASGFAVVSSGLRSGEEVATGQVFSLKALSRFKLISEE